MTQLIAILALCTSLLLLIVHYRNQVERRHGEIAKLLSNFLRDLSAAQNRLMSLQIHMETIRLELRRMPDCDDKYDCIEVMPLLIKRAQELGQKFAQLQSNLGQLDTTKMNRGNILILFQSVEHDFHSLEGSVNEVEQEALKTLRSIMLNSMKQTGDK